ncbi:EamA domain-containing membrane protein RarD [Paenibacillus sophorae]|uniref:DMT family transporter n=1 Tax=Paenibacillus sophorae TaxID=1333845 RepID=A0A1H8NBM0_9BACL|nr:DMT family transporter [Paenibacillus sophorae]QWU14695.1 DMT family transporter [Paenibacillus sophorae]SEO26977.1 EamA domain-containing membrane protein RarD [Paenibacillus sophorae]
MSNVTASSHTVRTAPLRGGFWLVALGAALWGVDPLFRILLLKSLTSSQIVLLEHVVLFLAAAPVLWRRRAELKGIRLRHAAALIFVSWGGSAVATILFTKALSSGDINAVVLLQKLQPLFAIGLAALLLKERLPRYFGPLVLLALLGTYLLTFGWSMPFGQAASFIGIGGIMALGAAALWGGSTVMGRYLLGTMKYETVTSLRFVLALPFLFVLTSMEGAPWQLHGGLGSSAAVAVNLLLQALLPGLLSMLLYYKGLSTTKASFATLAELSFPMTSLVLNWIVYRQLVTLPQVLGFAMIWTALFFISSQQSESLEAASQPNS